MQYTRVHIQNITDVNQNPYVCIARQVTGVTLTVLLQIDILNRIFAEEGRPFASYTNLVIKKAGCSSDTPFCFV